MGEFTKILKSFSLQDTLNPKVWENADDVESSKLKTKVKDALLKIAEKFIDYLGEDVFVEDITLTGSLANFNWSEFSDFDLHIIIDFSQYGKESKVHKELFDARKFIFNESHNIKIYGYDVELYAQDSEEEHTSSGLYSVMNDEWLHKPKKETPDIDKKILVQKIDSWIEKIEKTIKDSEKKDGKKLETLKKKIKEYRKSGLEKEGELSYENLVFKFLRRSGHIEKLFNALNKETDKELSVERNIQEQATPTKDDILKIFNDSEFLKELRDFADDGLTFEYTPGQKIPYSEVVRLIQKGLEFLEYKLPRWGVDGKFGPETKGSVEAFQKGTGLPVTGVVNVDFIKKLIALMVLNNFKDSYVNTSISQYGKVGEFTYLDLSTKEGFDAYKEICQAFIDSRNNKAGVTGEMMASCARLHFSKGYVPPELALAQLAEEGGLSSDEKNRPRRTKNPFNVGNVDSGANNEQLSVRDGVCLYYDLITRKYLVNKRPEDLLNNFVNKSGKRYASSPNYESHLKQIISGMSKFTEPVISKYGTK
jgi:peptidoglycan hydrolase-like protein with peptidoglycan-binding domain/predicted nucleotidyltransferase